MKKITKEEYDKLILRGAGRGSKFYKAIASLLPGEALIITRAEYTLARSPQRICKRLMKRYPQTKFTCDPLADGTGWAVKRVE